MAFTINTDIINEWRAKQRLAFESDPLPAMPEFSSGPGPSLGVRILCIVGAMINFTAPVMFMFYWFAPIIAKIGIGRGAPKIFAYFIFISITVYGWKGAFSLLLQGFKKSAEEHSVWDAAGHFDKKGQSSAALRHIQNDYCFTPS